MNLRWRQEGKGHFFGCSLAHQSLNTGVDPFVATISISYHHFPPSQLRLSPRLALLDVRISRISYFDALCLLKLLKLILSVTFYSYVQGLISVEYQAHVSNCSTDIQLGKYRKIITYRCCAIFVSFHPPLPVFLGTKHILKIFNSFHIITYYWENDSFYIY